MHLSEFPQKAGHPRNSDKRGVHSAEGGTPMHPAAVAAYLTILYVGVDIARAVIVCG